MSSMTGAGGMKSTERGGGPGDYIPKGMRKGQLQQFTPEQMQLFQQMFGQVSPDSYTSRLAGGDQSLFEQMEAPAMRQFSGVQGNIASRFSGQGMGGRRSSGFQNEMTSAGSNFAQDLQSRRQDLQRQAISDLMGMSNNLLQQRPYDQFITQKGEKQNPWGQVAGNFASAIPSALAGFAMGGPPGAIAGGVSGYAASAAKNAGLY